jgi:hypothetical protein
MDGRAEPHGSLRVYARVLSREWTLRGTQHLADSLVSLLSQIVLGCCELKFLADLEQKIIEALTAYFGCE